MDGQLKQEVVELTKAVLATFTTEYTKAYTSALVAKCIKDAKKPPSPYLLEKRPVSNCNNLKNYNNNYIINYSILL